MKVTKKMKRFAALLIAAVVMLSGVPLPSVQAAGDAKGVDVLTFTVKDEEGHPVEGVELDIYDRGGRTYTNLESKMGGVVRWNIPDYFSDYNGQVLEIKPINEEEEIGSITFKVKFDGFYTVIDTINGEPAENVKNLELTVNKKGGTVEDKPEITSVSLNKSSLENAGGVVQFSVKGKKLKDKVEVEVLKNGVAAGEVKIQQMENQETWNEYWITLPKNEETTAIEYTLRAKVTGDEASAKEAKVTVKEAEKPEVNKEALKQKITDAKAIENENYTEASWNALQAAIAAAEAVRDDADATQDAVDAQVTALKKAVDGLKENSEKPNPEKPNTEKPNTNKPNPNKPNTNKPNANKPNVDKNENAAPKTGDSAPFVPCMAGMICAAAVAGMVLKKRKSFE